MNKHDVNATYQLLMDGTYKGIDGTIETIFSTCRGEWSTCFVVEEIEDLYVPVNENDLLIDFTGTAAIGGQSQTINYLFVVSEDDFEIVYAEVAGETLSSDDAFSMLKQLSKGQNEENSPPCGAQNWDVSGGQRGDGGDYDED